MLEPPNIAQPSSGTKVKWMIVSERTIEKVESVFYFRIEIIFTENLQLRGSYASIK